MPNTSPYDLIRKARRQTTTPDRWAAILSSTQDRTPVAPPQSAPPQAQPVATPGYSPPHSPATPPKQAYAPPYAPPPPQEIPAREPGGPAVMQPPFPPPQPRHPFLDEIEKRHSQALKTAVHKQAWQPGDGKP